MFTERLLKMPLTLTSNSHDDIPDEWSWWSNFSDSESNEIGWTHSPILYESCDSSQGFPFGMKDQSSVRLPLPKFKPELLVRSYPIFFIIRYEFLRLWEKCGDSELSSKLLRVNGSELNLPNRIGFWPSYLAGSLKKASWASSDVSWSIRDELNGACNDVKTSIVDRGSLSTSV